MSVDYEFQDVFELADTYVDFVLQKSGLSHGALNNISLSGDQVEDAVKDILRHVLPNRFRVTSGHIVSAESRKVKPTISPQVDVIVVDNFVSSTPFYIEDDDSNEMVFKESVVAIFEVKRKLNKKTLFGNKQSNGALKHLDNIIDSANLTKSNDTHFLLGGFKLTSGKRVRIETNMYNNPFVGVIGLESTQSMFLSDEKRNFFQYWQESELDTPFDCIISLKKGAVFTCGAAGDGQKFIKAHTVREEGVVFSEANENLGVFSVDEGNQSKMLISNFLGFLNFYLGNTCGDRPKINNYFFNTCLQK